MIIVADFVPCETIPPKKFWLIRKASIGGTRILSIAVYDQQEFKDRIGLLDMQITSSFHDTGLDYALFEKQLNQISSAVQWENV